jgi:hypothetical protein
MMHENVFHDLIKGSEIRIDPKSFVLNKVFYIVKDGKCIFSVWFRNKDAHKMFLVRTRLGNCETIDFKDIDINLSCSNKYFYNLYVYKCSILISDKDEKRDVYDVLSYMFKKYFSSNYIKQTIEDVEFEDDWEFLTDQG